MLKNRLRRCAERLGSGARLARETEIPRRTLETYLSGVAEPKASRLERIARASGVCAHWLLTGEGNESPDDARRMVEFVASRRSATDASGPEPRRDEQGPSEPPGRMAFSVDWIRRQGWQERNLHLLESRGDCMAPTVMDEALMLVDVSVREIREEGIYVLEVNGDLLVRRVQTDIEGGLIIANDNPAYRQQHLSQGLREKLSVFGRVVWVGNSLDR